MKLLKHTLAISLGAILLVTAGCGNKSSSDYNSTNSVSSSGPSTNELMNNNPPAGMTNSSTNMPVR